MKHTKITLISLILLSSLFMACSSQAEESAETVELGDVKISKDASGSDVVLNDASFEAKKESARTFGEKREGSTQTMKDGSRLDISYDGGGNKVEYRYFFNHANLQSLIVTTTPKGKKEVTVFGHNRENKTLPPDAVDALTAPADDIARTAGITTTKIKSPEKFTVVKNTQPTQVAPTINSPTVVPQQAPPPATQTTEPQQTEQPNVSPDKPDGEGEN